jgi:galactokinase
MSKKDFINTFFETHFKHHPEQSTHAPGRVNLIGEHTDFNDGFVLPAAINFGTDIAASRRKDRQIHVVSHDFKQESRIFSLDDIKFNSTCMWVNYVAGSLKMLMKSYPDIRGANIAISGNVPIGAGLSSSASLEIAILKTFTSLYQLSLDGINAAKKGQQAENDFVGCNCGIMDQLISSMGKKGHAMLLDCRDLNFTDAPIPNNLSLFIVNSNVKRRLIGSEYNLRRTQCEEAANYFKKPALRDVNMEMLEAASKKLPNILYRRARHIITENDRTVAALSALKEGDTPKLSLLMKASHRSLKHDFEVTIPETDGLVEIIDNVLGNNGGVRMTGGGFGGCVIALAPTTLLETLTEVVNVQYSNKFGIKPSIYQCSAEQGAFRV